MPTSDYDNCLTTMFQLHRFGIKLGLDIISAMLAALDNPQNNYRAIHIAGTNGKGSVAAMLSNVLRLAGFRVGRYTSPHLERFNERICIDDEPVSDDDVVSACRRSMAIDGLSRQPTFFEFTTAMALDLFHRHGVQWAVIETGMGGRLDATNVLKPDLSIITNISIEHREYLGGTIEAIAGEKAGIIKDQVPILTGAKQAVARHVIANQAAAHSADCFMAGRDFKIRRQSQHEFSYYGIDTTWQHLQLGLSGDHQVDNAAIALAACEIINDRHLAALEETAVREGLLQTRWPGRLEVVSTTPYLILDGAHNRMAARVLRHHLEKAFKNRDITLVVGILDDKPYRAILKDLIAPCRRIIITEPRIDRALPVHRLEKIAKTFNPAVQIKKNVADAVRHALETSRKDDVICVAGSLYVVGEAKTAIKELSLT